jgi:hypothetical protein
MVIFMGDLSLNLINKDYNSNSSRLLNNANVIQREVQYKNKLYSMNGKFVGNKNDDSKNLFWIFHQYIRGMNGKIDKLIISLHNQLPNVLCLTKHHVNNYEINAVHIAKYINWV